MVTKKSKKKKKRKEEGGGGPCAESTGNCRQTGIEALHAGQVGRRQQGVGEGRPVLRRHLKGNEGEGRPPEGRTRGPVYPEDQIGGSLSGPQKVGRRLGLPRGSHQAVGESAEISSLVLTRSLEIRDLDETIEKENVVSVLCLALGRTVLDGSCRLLHLLWWGEDCSELQLGKVRICGLRAASASMWKSPDASGALVTAMGPETVATPTGRMPVGDAAPLETCPGAVRRRQAA